MAFDMGFDFRHSLAFVTDPAYAVFVPHTDVYPHTYTNSNGLSINGGWNVVGDTNDGDRSNTNDPRIAGINYALNTAQRTFKIDLSSGSAPGSGLYSLDFACGDQGSGQPQHLLVKDNNSTLITVNATTLAGHFIDATLADVTASATWTGTPSIQTFATTTVNITQGDGADANFTTLAHFRLTLQTVASNVLSLLQWAHGI